MSQIQVELQGVFGDDRVIASSAWTSSLTNENKQNRSDEDVARVVNMLADQHHSTPFESIIFRFWIKLPIAIDRQFMTHRLQSPNGMSGRYRTMPSEFLQIPEDVVDLTKKALTTLYGPSKEVQKLINSYNILCQETNFYYARIIKNFKYAKDDNVITNDEYKRLREFYRGVLPQHNMTERTTTMNLRSFANFIKLRNSEHAQPEIREVAQLMLAAVEASGACPVALEALRRNNWSI